MPHWINVLLFLVIYTATLLCQINAAEQSLPWVIKDEIINVSINVNHQYVATGENLIIRCHIARTCLSAKLALCTDPDTVTWFTPNTLPPKDNTQRKQIDFLYKNVSQNINSTIHAATTSVNITSTLKLNQIGFVHEGHYACTSLTEQMLFNFHVKENDRRACIFHDQCLSYNCYDGTCRCNQTNENYVPQTKSCVTRKLLGEECDLEAQCQIGNNITVEPDFKQRILPPKCAKYNSTSNTCQCTDNGVQVKLATVTVQFCLPKTFYGEGCYSNAQCQHSVDDGSFCGIDMQSANKSFQLLCQCKDGWRHSPGNGGKSSSSCTPYARCDSSKLGFNEHFLQGSCWANQFCRNNYCLCAPNYEFNAAGQCVPQRALNGEQYVESFLEQYFYEIIGGIVLVTIVIASLAIIHFIKAKFAYRRRKQELKSNVRLNGVTQNGNHRY